MRKITTPRTIDKRARHLAVGDVVLMTSGVGTTRHPIVAVHHIPVGYGPADAPLAESVMVDVWFGSEHASARYSADTVLTILAPIVVWHERTSDVARLRSPIPEAGDLAYFRALHHFVKVRVTAVDPVAVTVDLMVTATGDPVYVRGEQLRARPVNFVTLRLS